MFSSGQAEAEPAWTGFAMEQIMKTLSFVNSSLVQAPREEKEKLAHKLDDTLYCAKYERKYQISNGPFSSVFCIKQRGKRYHTHYAAKYLRANTERAVREVDVLLKLQHCPQVIRFIEVFHCEFHTILVTEFLPGGDLFERVAATDYKLTEEKVQILMKQIIKGLEYIHELNIVHLDIKPYNILFSDKNSDYGLKIIDFGLARELGESGQVDIRKLQGTIEFMSPEVMNCKQAGTSADMWSVGVVTYMLLTGGKSPFYDGSRFKTMAKALKCEYEVDIPELRKVSGEARDLVQRLLLASPDRRLTAEECLAHPWLSGDVIYIDVLNELETTWMRRCLARRRWYRALNALKAMHTMQKLTFPETVPDSEVVARMAPTRVTVVEETLADPKDFEEYKMTYENIVLVGAGTYGSVYYVRERETGEVAAAKYLRQEKVKVRREAQILRALIQSAFVVRLAGLYESNLNSVLVTEYLAGGDLVTRTAPDDYNLTERKCQIFIRQIVRGVHFIHSKGVLHLDLKPFNIMFANVQDDYNLRIIDFGLAEQLAEDSEDVVMSMCGTLEYMSPEVMDCKHASRASDMWGVGVIAYLLVSGGVSPFWGGNRYRTMAKTLTCDYTLDLPNFEHISPNGKDFISKLLVLDPKSRLTAAECLSHPWMTDNRVYVEVLHSLQTSWMRGILARRRWHRWHHAITAMNRMRQLSLTSDAR